MGGDDKASSTRHSDDSGDSEIDYKKYFSQGKEYAQLISFGGGENDGYGGDKKQKTRKKVIK